MEYIKDIEVVITADTNKRTIHHTLVMGMYNENETQEEFIDRIKLAIINIKE